ncbi:MAG: type II secretion system F family protein [Microbacterium sp.]
MSTVTIAACAVILGTAFAAGLLLAAVRVPRWSAPTLSRRIAPYLRDITDPRGLTPLAALGSGAPAWSLSAVRDRLAARLNALGAGGGEAVAHRLRQAGWAQDALGFRAMQLVWAVVGLGAGGLLAVALTLAGRGAVAAVLPPLLTVAAVVACDYRLTSAARRRIARIEDELPTVLEFLALCLAAGEGLRDALCRVGDVGSGELTGELRGAVLASGTGSNLPDALLQVARDVDVPALSRAVEHLVAAMDRGAPLAHVLQEQAVDAREDAKRALIEAAGRKEILMLLPLVFLILPLSVLFAIFPGVVMLGLGIG